MYPNTSKRVFLATLTSNIFGIKTVLHFRTENMYIIHKNILVWFHNIFFAI